jgi:hypothetical protein
MVRARTAPGWFVALALVVFVAPATAATEQVLLLPNVAAGGPPEWDAPIVPRRTPGAGGPVSVADSLLATQPTYLNWSTRKNQSVCATWTDQLFLDGEMIQELTRQGCEWEVTWHAAIDQGPTYVRGGRHELSMKVDVYWTSGEDYDFRSDNEWSAQWVWGPTTVPKNTTYDSRVLGEGPPPRGWRAQPNSDGYRIDRDTPWAWVAAAVASDVAENYDLIVYVDPWQGSTSGFSVEGASSSQSAGTVDFVVGAGHSSPASLFPAVVRGGETGEVDYFRAWTDAAARRDSLADSQWEHSLGWGQLAAVYDVWLDAGTQVDVDLARTSGTDDLAFAIFSPDPSALRSRAQAAAASVPFQGEALDAASYVPAASGWHPLVVFREQAAAVHENAGYVLRIGPSATVGAGSPAPATLFLAGAAPNPASSRARFAYGLPVEGAVRIAIFDAQGRCVRTLVDGREPAGARQAEWDLRDGAGTAVGPGLYWARLEFAGRSVTRRLSVVR